MSTTGYVLGFIGAALMVASYLMKSMLPLRVVALSANVILVSYAWIAGSWPTMVLYLAMIPINLRKVNDIRRLTDAIRRSRADTPLSQWLLPHMTRREVPAGTVLWRKDDVATEMVYLHSGRLRIVEFDQPVEPGELIGEIGLFLPDNHRTAGVVAETDCTLYALSASAMAQLYYQNPKLGWHVVRLMVQRLSRDAQRAYAAAHPPAAAGPAPAQPLPPAAPHTA